LAKWAAFSSHYVTAWSNWELAHGAFRLQVSRDELSALQVWGWGGSTTLAELQLARYEASNCVLLSRDKRARDVASQMGFDALDPRRFGELLFDEERYRRDDRYRSAYQEAEAAFLAEVESRTAGRKVQIFIDMLGAPVYRATLKALSREGVLTTTGGEHPTEELRILRAVECIQRHQHIFTHGARYSQGQRAVAFAETSGWMPLVDARIYTFDEIPELAAAYRAGQVGPFPIFAVNQ
jgi:NADPH:quinone reductase-like Zn-dependent oxidoreductase